MHLAVHIFLYLFVLHVSACGDNSQTVTTTAPLPPKSQIPLRQFSFVDTPCNKPYVKDASGKCVEGFA